MRFSFPPSLTGFIPSIDSVSKAAFSPGSLGSKSVMSPASLIPEFKESSLGLDVSLSEPSPVSVDPPL